MKKTLIREHNITIIHRQKGGRNQPYSGFLGRPVSKKESQLQSKFSQKIINMLFTSETIVHLNNTKIFVNKKHVWF